MLPVINDHIEKIVWGNHLQSAGRAGRFAATLLRFLYGLARDIVYGQLTLRSMSLVYTTLLSVVPLIAFSFSVLKGFGIHEQLEPLLYDFLMPLGEQGERIGSEVMALVDNVKGGLLGGISLAFFIYTAISMVQKVEESFNYVWYVSKPRSFARRFTEYTIVLLIGPVAVVVAIGILASIQSNDVTQYVLNSAPLSPLVIAFGKL
ncbi:MAG: YihY/virulence factor BrkB family protein, partial [Woeseia sp.]